MTTTHVYQQLLDEIDGDMERKVLAVLVEHAGVKVTRQDLVLYVFGHYVKANQLSASTEDRQIRECIERLRASWPIVSSSGEPGYVLEDNEDRIREFAAEQESRAEKNRQAAKAAYGWLPKARAIQEARRSASDVPVQPSLI